MNKKRNKTEWPTPTTIKGAIIEIILSLVAIIAIFAFAIWGAIAYKNTVNQVQQLLWGMLNAMGAALFFFLDGIIAIISICKKRSKEKTKDSQNSEKKNEKTDEDIEKNN